MISILVPSRGRPKELARMLASVKANTLGDYEVLVYLNEDDPALADYDAPFKLIGPDRATSKSWNELAAICRGDLLMLAADDIMFQTHGWDLMVAKAAPKDGIGVIGCNDLRGKRGNPHPIITRRMYEALGYLAMPSFHHWYVDTWLNRIAEKLGRFIYLPDVIVEHMTFKNNKAPMDETYRRIRRDATHNDDAHAFLVLAEQLDAEVEKLVRLMK